MNNVAAVDRFIVLSEGWESKKSYMVVSRDERIEASVYPGLSGSEYFDETSDLFFNPYASDDATVHEMAWVIEDFASSQLRSGRVLVSDLVDRLRKEVPLSTKPFIEGCLRFAILRGIISLWFDRRKTDVEYSFELTPSQVRNEHIRSFASTFASDLHALSDRVRLLVHHKASVGTYRESLLQTLLKKHLPERYHVATGFILGCERQIDILIYDRMHYAAVLKEGDFVVVAPDAVRAVVEVKTTLTKAFLTEALDLLSEVGIEEDGKKPMFKGIFAFGSPMTHEAVLGEITRFHIANDEDGWPIVEPFQHMTCACVLGGVFAYIDYVPIPGGTAYRPALFERRSGIGLPSQAAYFLESLLSYLRMDTDTPCGNWSIERMLGVDTKDRQIGELVGEFGWGPYFEGGNAGPSREDVESRITSIRVALHGD